MNMAGYAISPLGMVAAALAISCTPAAAAEHCCSLAPTKAAKPFSDTFTKDTALNPGWVLSEPNAASSYSIGKKGLLLDASGQNGGADLWPFTNYDASVLLQPVTPTLNWTVSANMQFASVNNYMGAGLVLTTQTSGFTSASVFHRFEYGHNPVQGLESFTNGSPDPAYVGFSGSHVTLRLQKSGSTYTYSYSTDGKTFTTISTVTDTNAYSYIGVISIRQPYDGETTVDTKPIFKYFKIKIPKK